MYRSPPDGQGALRAAAKRIRQKSFAAVLAQAWREGRRICALDGGDFAEGLALAGRDMSNVTLVVRERTDMARAAARHGHHLVIELATPAAFLNRTVRLGECWDLIYLKTLADSLDDAGLEGLVDVAIQALSSKGELLIGNLAPGPAADAMAGAAVDSILYPRSVCQLAALAWPEHCSIIVWSDPADIISFAKFERI